MKMKILYQVQTEGQEAYFTTKAKAYREIVDFCSAIYLRQGLEYVDRSWREISYQTFAKLLLNDGTILTVYDPLNGRVMVKAISVNGVLG